MCCIICLDWQKGILTAEGAYRNLMEMKGNMDPDHAEALERRTIEAMVSDQGLWEWFSKEPADGAGEGE